MNSIPLPSSAPNATPAETALQARRLEHMIQAGMEIMDLVLHEARTAAEAAPDDPARKSGKPGKVGDHVLAFSRITLSIRQAMALAARLKPAAVTVEPAAAAKPPAGKSPGQDQVSPQDRARERRLKRLVRSFIETQVCAQSEDDAEITRLLQAVDARLNDPAFMIEFGPDPIGVIVGTISDDVGVKFDGTIFTDEELGARWPADQPNGYKNNSPKKVCPADFGYREEATAAYLAQGLPLPVIPPTDTPA